MVDGEDRYCAMSIGRVEPLDEQSGQAVMINAGVGVIGVSPVERAGVIVEATEDRRVGSR